MILSFVFLVSSVSLVLTSAPLLAAPITFSRDIAPIVNEHCSTCHRPGGSAPFSLLAYADVRPRARQIVSAVTTRSMPPWKPEPGYGNFADVRRLSDAEIDLFSEWFRQGSLQGDPDRAPPARPNETWRLGPPDVVVRLASPYRLAPGGADRMRNFVLSVPIDRRRYVRAWEFRTNAPQVVHHATMVLDSSGASRHRDEQDPAPGYEGLIPLSAQNPDGYFLGWTPGQTVSAAPDDMAWHIDPGTDLILMLHLRPGTEWQPVDASVGLYFTDAVPTRVPAMIRLNRQDIDIAPDESRYVINDSYTLPVDVSAYSVQPHAHNLAREIKGSALLPDGSRQSLIYIRNWDFHWQDVYRYERPVFLPAGTRLDMEYVYDNSRRNRANPNDPPARVGFGQRTTDEMGDLWIQVVPRNASDLPVLNASLQRKLLPQNIQGYRMMLRSNPREAGLHDDLALLHVQNDDFEAAAGEFAESLRLAPERPAAHYNVGNALLALRRLGDAERHFRQALQLQPDYGLARQGLGLALAGQGQLAAAAEQFAAAVKVMPTADVHYNYGIVQTRLGDTAAAVRSLRAALTLRPEWHEAEIELAWNLAASPDEGVRNPREALDRIQRIVASDRAASAHALDVMAAALAATGRFDEAIATAQHALAVMRSEEQAMLESSIRERIQLYRAGGAYRIHP